MTSQSSIGQQRAPLPTSTPQLSCELCSERKVKCDKLQPCTTCVTANVECKSIFRERLPRGRHLQKKTAAINQSQKRPRTQRRESQQQQRQRQQMFSSPEQTRAGTSNSDNNHINHASTANLAAQTSEVHTEKREPFSTTAAVPYSGSDKGKSNGISSFEFEQTFSPLSRPDESASAALLPSTKDMALMTPNETFWMDTSGKFDDSSRSAFTVSDDHGNDVFQTADILQPDPGNGPFKMLCAARQTSTSTVLPNVSLVTTLELFKVFLEQVDPVIKILHRQSLSKLMERGESYLGYPEGHTSVAGLGAAVCYAAACSLSETQSRVAFQESKASIVSSTQAACENALERADVLVATDITVLQAFVLYLVGRRSTEQGRVVWSLLPLAVRLAKGISLHVDPVSSARGYRESFFDRQMRKRLWLTICVMDLQAAFAYGSEPLIRVEEVSSALNDLRHVNDCEFEPTTTQDLMDKEELTDVTFSFVAFFAQVSGRLLHYASQVGDADTSGTRNNSAPNAMGSRSRGASSAGITMNRDARERMSAAFEQKAFNLLRFCDPEDSRQAWFTWHGTQALVAATRLAAIRPSQQARFRVDDAWTTDALSDERIDAELQAGIRILDEFQLMRSDPRGEGLRWYLMVPLQALEAVVAGCCLCKDEVLIRRAWPLVEFVWQAQQSQSGPQDQRAVATQLETQIRRARDILRPLLQPGKTPMANIRADSIFGNSGSTNSTPLRTPTVSRSASMSYFPLTAAVTAIDDYSPSLNTAATGSTTIQRQTLPQKHRNNTPMQDIFGSPTSFSLGHSLPMQVDDLPFQAWDDVLLGPVDESMNDSEMTMANLYSGNEMMPI